jgi:hypothetical protein
MSDPRKAAAAKAGPRLPRKVRGVGWALSALLWAAASDARPVLALLSLLAALTIRCVYVVMTRVGIGRSVFWSPWFFAVAALCELVWLFVHSSHVK